MKTKTNTLTGAALDLAVAKAWQSVYSDAHLLKHARGFCPSTDWAHGGPIIEKEHICIDAWPNDPDDATRWLATIYEKPAICECAGPTPLIAAMRCYVASKLGDEVDVPEGLK